MTKEIWKRVIGYPDYEISDKGRVKSYKAFPPKILKGSLGGGGYRRIKLSNKGIIRSVYIAPLVAKHFIGPCPKGYDVSHKNENHVDNKAVNLCYETHSQNCNRPMFRKRCSISQLIGKSGYKGVRLTPYGKYRASIWYNQRINNIGTYSTAKEAAKAFDVVVKKLKEDIISTNKRLGLL